MQEIIAMLCGKFFNKKNQMIMLLLVGIQYSIKQFINLTAKKLKMKIFWKGNGIKRKRL